MDNRFFLGGILLLLPALCASAPQEFCKTYAEQAAKQYGMMRADPSYECHPDKEYMPLWSPDPRDHYNWCTDRAISTGKAAREIERRERFLVEACQYDMHYAEAPKPTVIHKTEVTASPKKRKSFFHKRIPAKTPPSPPAATSPGQALSKGEAKDESLPRR